MCAGYALKVPAEGLCRSLVGAQEAHTPYAWRVGACNASVGGAPSEGSLDLSLSPWQIAPSVGDKNFFVVCLLPLSAGRPFKRKEVALSPRSFLVEETLWLCCSEEKICRFCNDALPNWQSAFAYLPRDSPIMTIRTGEAQEAVHVQPGIEGMQTFKEKLCQLHGVGTTVDLDVSFQCQSPDTGKLQSKYACSSGCF